MIRPNIQKVNFLAGDAEGHSLCSIPGLQFSRDAMSLGIYIQVPFCQTKCTYCNFHTGVVSRDRFQPYAEAISREIADTAGVAPAQIIDTIYFGGGTPSLLDPAALALILDSLRHTYPIDAPPE